MNGRERIEMIPMTPELFTYACAVDKISPYVFNLNVALRGKPHSERFNEDKQNVALAYDTYHKLKHQLKQMDRAGILEIYSPLLEVLEDKIKEIEDRFINFWKGTRRAS